MNITINKNWCDEQHLDLIDQAASALNAAGILDNDTYNAIFAATDKKRTELQWEIDRNINLLLAR